MRSGFGHRPAEDRFVVTDRPDADDVAFLEDRVVAATVAATGRADARELAILVREPEGSLRAGVYGWTWGGCCELQYLWVDDQLAGHGLGRDLIEAAETEARRRGCRQVVLFTFDSQAPRLYRHLGYALVGTIDDYPTGGAAHWFRKRLDVLPDSTVPRSSR